VRSDTRIAASVPYGSDMPVEQLDPHAAKAAIEAGAAVLDVREQDEWDAGRLAGSQHVPLSQLGQRLDELPPDGPLLVVCRSGVRSDMVAAHLDRLGRDGCANLAGGLEAWAGAGLPLEPPGGRVV
jgi:rhodanese-related sulfurtransferase